MNFDLQILNAGCKPHQDQTNRRLFVPFFIKF